MKFETINYSDIDLDYRNFRIGLGEDISELKDSIKCIGIINPPTLRKYNSTYQIVCGWKRIESCLELDIKHIFSRVYEYGEISDEKCLNLLYHDNVQRIGDIEKSELLSKYIDLIDLNEQQLREEVFPILQIHPSKKSIEKFIKLTKLQREIRDAYYSGEISQEQCVLLSVLDESGDAVDILKRIIIKYKLNNNESRETIRYLDEISKRDNITIGDVIDIVELRIEGNGNKNRLRSEVASLRLSELFEIESLFKDKIERYKIPQEVKLTHSPYFEGNDLELRIKINSSDKFRELLSYFSSLTDEGGVDELLQIVREGASRKI